MRYASGFLSRIYNYNPISFHLKINSQNDPLIHDAIPKIQESLNKTKYDIQTHIPFKNSTNESIEETNSLYKDNRYNTFLEGFSNW
jgi:predicted alpha/beta-fold hydrolase